jgi:hypothetical protein
MDMSREVATAIEGLSAADVDARARAAREIYDAGKKAAEHATEKWWSNAELAALLLGAKREVTVGVAVQRETFGKIRVANSVAMLAEVPWEQDAEEFEMHFDGGVELDVLTSRAPGGDGAIAKFLAKFGEGIQQVEFRCRDVEKAAAILKEELGVKAIYAETRSGADGTRINFFLVEKPEGGKILIELYEKKP